MLAHYDLALKTPSWSFKFLKLTIQLMPLHSTKYLGIHVFCIQCIWHSFLMLSRSYTGWNNLGSSLSLSIFLPNLRWCPYFNWCTVKAGHIEMPKERWREKKKRDWRDGETNCRPKKNSLRMFWKCTLECWAFISKKEICETNDSVLLLCCRGLAVIQKSKWYSVSNHSSCTSVLKLNFSQLNIIQVINFTIQRFMHSSSRQYKSIQLCKTMICAKCTGLGNYMIHV